jgi:tyrosyl-tRNA synthetase
VGLSYTEFAYPLLQAYDYLELHKSYGCDLQVGGSDQWGNIIAGVDLVRRIAGAEVHALTVPLITDKTTGKKFGKSEGNAVWLDAEKTSPYAFYQFWFNTADENVIDYLKLFTMLPLEEIEEMEQTVFANPGERTVQKILATEVTAFVHGKEVCEQVAEVSACLFGEKRIAELSETERSLLKEVAPTTSMHNGVSLVDAVVSTGLATSKREARTFVESGAVSVAGEKVVDIGLVLDTSVHGDIVHIKRGKRNVALVVLE